MSTSETYGDEREERPDTTGPQDGDTHTRGRTATAEKHGEPGPWLQYLGAVGMSVPALLELWQGGPSMAALMGAIAGPGFLLWITILMWRSRSSARALAGELRREETATRGLRDIEQHLVEAFQRARSADYTPRRLPPKLLALAGLPVAGIERCTPYVVLDAFYMRCVGRETLDAHEVETELASFHVARLEAATDRYSALSVRLGFLGSLVGVVMQAYLASGIDGSGLVSGSFLVGILVSATSTIQGLLVYLYIEQLRSTLASRLDQMGSDVLRFARRIVLRVMNKDPGDPTGIQRAVDKVIDTLERTTQHILKEANGQLDARMEEMDQHAKEQTRALADMLLSHAGKLEHAMDAKVAQLKSDMEATLDSAEKSARRLVTDSLRHLVEQSIKEPVEAFCVHIDNQLDKTRSALTQTSEKMHHASDILAARIQRHYDAPDTLSQALQEAKGAFQDSAWHFRDAGERISSAVNRLEDASRQISETTRAHREDVSSTVRELSGDLDHMREVARAIREHTSAMAKDSRQMTDDRLQRSSVRSAGSTGVPFPSVPSPPPLPNRHGFGSGAREPAVTPADAVLYDPDRVPLAQPGQVPPPPRRRSRD